MKVWTAHSRDERGPELVREGFSWGATFFGPLWLLAHRAWIPAALTFAAWVLLAALARPASGPALGWLLAFATGIFGNDARRWSLSLAGYGLAGIIAARDEDAAFVRLVAARPDLIADAAGLRRERARSAESRVRIAVVDYGSGNLASAARALALAAERAGIAASVEVTSDADAVARADRIVLPGQGAFADCAAGLAALDGMTEAIGSATAAGAPFLGICVGMQLMAERGLEHRVTRGFGWVSGEIAPMRADGLRLPQMGWNALDFEPGSHHLLDGIAPGDHAYFVHSYALAGGDAAQVLATADYGGAVPAMIASGARAGTQFHVEKSQEVGLRILSNFLLWRP